MPYLTKSRYVRGITCRKLLWLGWHERLPYAEPEAGSPQAVGIEVGRLAQQLFPGGVTVEEEAWQHEIAVERTADLMANRSVPAIFEAAFTFDKIRIRADVIERLPDGRWGLREVKSSTRVKPEHVDDAAIQYYVMKGLGLDVASIELVHVNSAYVRGADGIDWGTYFTRTDMGHDVAAVLPEVAEEVAQQFGVLEATSAPDIPASPHCPDTCDYWERCSAGKPTDWIMTLPRLSQGKFDALHGMGIEAIGDIPEDFRLTEIQDRVRDAIVLGSDYISANLSARLDVLGEGASFLDFEAMNPAIPLYEGTRPYQRIPFQWSLHERSSGGVLRHREFLARDGADPRAQFVRTLIEAVAGSELPIVVYSSYEKGVLLELARDFPDYSADIGRILDRLFDLLAVVRSEVYLRAFNGSFSIKAVGPALAADFTYQDLGAVKDGEAASIAFQKLAAGELPAGQAEELRQALLAYCERDTLAMVAVHDALFDLTKAVHRPAA